MVLVNAFCSGLLGGCRLCFCLGGGEGGGVRHSNVEL